MMLQRGAIGEADHRPEPPGPSVRDVRTGARWLSPDDRAALGMWAAAHLALFVLAWAAAWVYRTRPDHGPLTGVFEHWDAVLLRNIAEYGYFSPHSFPHDMAFFPGYPMTLAAVHLILPSWVLSELVISAVAGNFAVVSLSRLAGGRRAVLYLLAAPAAIFLMVGYSESLFLAFAIPAWRAATRGRWWRTALLAGLSGLVRPDAAFLIPALAVMALTGARGSRLANAAKTCCALAGPATYQIYLRVHTGTWRAWATAKQVGWDLHLVTPVQALKTTWWVAFRHGYSAAFAFGDQLELAAMAAMLLATLAFLWWRRWPEAVYCGLAVLTLGTQTWYQSCPRTLLVLFPIWIALARLEARQPWVRYVYFGVSAPLAAVVGLLFLTYQWAG
jgi:Mannosyltransferase (PIG-V)